MSYLPGVSQRLSSVRRLRNMEIGALAANVGVSEVEYADLENHDDEFTGVLSLEVAARVCKELNVSIGFVLADLCDMELGQPEIHWDLHQLQKKLRLVTSDLSRSENMKKLLSYDVRPFIDDISEAQSWNLDCLFDVLSYLKEDWRDYLID
jgi:transcriptional regulator with XRE-family HTH domain